MVARVVARVAARAAANTINPRPNARMLHALKTDEHAQVAREVVEATARDTNITDPKTLFKTITAVVKTLHRNFPNTPDTRLGTVFTDIQKEMIELSMHSSMALSPPLFDVKADKPTIPLPPYNGAAFAAQVAAARHHLETLEMPAKFTEQYRAPQMAQATPAANEVELFKILGQSFFGHTRGADANDPYTPNR